MANLDESATYDAGVYQLEVTDPVQGGSDGVSNKPQKNLANRTTWLKQKVDLLLEALANALAPLNSPAFTGSPTAPDVPLGDSSGKIANTKFVQGTANGVLTKSVAGGVNVSLTAVEAGNAIYVLTGAITANIAVIVPASGKSMIVDNRTTGAFTLTIKTAAGTGIPVAQGKKRELFCDGTNVLESTNDLTDAVLLNLPTTPTAPIGTDSTQVASTAFARSLVDGLVAVNVAGSGGATLTPAQADAGIINLTGAITANINVVVPTKSGQSIIANNTTGAFNVTCKTAAGTGVILPQGLAVVVYCDGVNVYLASSSGQVSMRPVALAPAAGTTSLTILGGYTPGNILVEKNGALLEPADFTATNGTTVVVAATTAGDTFTVYAFNSFSVANAVQKSGDSMAGPLNLVTPAQFDASTLAASTAFVRGAVGSYSGFRDFTSNGALVAADVGKYIGVSSDGLIITLPSTAGLPIGSLFTFGSVRGFTLAAVGGTLVDFGGSGGPAATSKLIFGFSSVIWRGDYWQVVMGGDAATLSGNGYQKMPSGLIIQWGGGSIAGQSTTTFSFPIVFPVGGFMLVGAKGASIGLTSEPAIGFNLLNAAQFIATNSSSGTALQGFSWLAVGR